MGANETLSAQFGPVTVSMAREVLRCAALQALQGEVPAGISSACSATPRIGEYWAAQAGIYSGRIVGEDDRIYALIVARRADGEIEKSSWDQAGKKAVALKVGGFLDWALPNRMEALAMWQRLHPLLKNTDDAFGTDVYWTSAQHASDSSYAWYQSFDYGGQYDYRKGKFSRARAVRRVVLSN